MDVILVVNAGSSSLKFQSFGLVDGGLQRRVRGQVDGIGVRPRLRIVDSAGAVLIDRSHEAAEIPDLPAAIGVLRDWLKTRKGITLRAIGHRVVHGGPDFDRAVLIDEDILNRLSRYQTLAPLHQPNNLAPIRLAMAIAPDAPQVACFDTAFHRLLISTQK